MRYKPERALTPDRNVNSVYSITTVEMRYKPERALTHVKRGYPSREFSNVEMRYKPERALTPYYPMLFLRIILE